MIKRTLYFGNPAYLSTSNQQLVINLPAAKQAGGEDIPGTGATHTAPIEDIGVMILDHPQITITQALMDRLLTNNTALITCNGTHHPIGLLLNLDGNTLQSQKFKAQIEASEPLKKQLWQQTIVAKITNQASVLGANAPSEGEVQQEFSLSRKPDKLLLALARDVRSGDPDNMEARAAAYYWKNMFPIFPDFTREREGDPPNNLLNYGYAILRAIVARSLTGSGLLPTLGIHHRNQYNAYCLADDIMEPYRPYVDRMVCNMIARQTEVSDAYQFMEMTPDIKKELLTIPALDVSIDDQKSPLMNAVQRTTASLVKCYEGKTRKILYPVL
jgi:CRISPR-associated protein Cas1